MRLVLMSTLLLVLPAGLCRASEPVTLTVLPAAEVGPQVVHAKGPDGEPAVEVIGGPEQKIIALLAFDAPENTTPNFVLRGKMKAAGVIDGKTALWLRSEIVTDAGSRPGSHFSIISIGDWYEFKIHSLHNDPQQAVGKVKRIELDLSVIGDCKLALDGSLVLAPMVKSGDQWEAQEPIATLALRSPEEMTPRVATVRGPAGEPAIDVAGGPNGGTYALAAKELPRISSPDYMLRGRVKYADVAGDAYLELLNDFGEHGTYFTRSLADSGPLKKLTGTSDWRDFELPFHAQPGMVPKRLTLNVVLPGAGTVTVAEPLVVTPLGVMSPWWTPLQGIAIGVSLSACFGLLAGLIGLTIFSGKSTPLIASLCGAGLAIGGVALFVGLIALCASQPWHVSFPLLLVGGIGASSMGLTLQKIVHRSQVDELRRMTAADVL